MSNEVERYLTAYDQAEDMAMGFRRAADCVERVVRAMRAGSKVACTEALPHYPTADQIRTLLRSLDEAKDRVHQLWDAVPAEMRHRLPQPGRVGRPRTEVSFVDE
jgi:hypothetical protein